MSSAGSHGEKPGPAKVRAWGAFFFPPIFLGSPLERQEVERGEAGALAKALATRYRGCPTVVTRNGLVVIGEGTKTRAQGLLNEIMATFLLWSIPVYAVEERDLLEAWIDLASMEIEGLGQRRGTPQGIRQGTGIPPVGESLVPKYYAPENIRTMIGRAEALTGDSAIKLDLLLLLEAYTLHQHGAYTESFLLSWLAVERWVQALWRDLLQGQGLSPALLGNLSEPAWTIDRMVEVLCLWGRIDPASYTRVTELRGKRNAIMLRADGTTKGEAAEAFHFVLSRVRARTLAGST